MVKICIIGGGGGGIAAAQAAWETDKEAQITLICGEGVLPYSRIRICEILSGLDAAKLTLRTPQWFAERNIQTLFTIVEEINPAAKTLKTGDGQNLSYDKLIIATGSNGRILPVEGRDNPGVMAFRRIRDIEAAMAIEGPAVIIGGGLLGLEAAWHLAKGGRQVTIVEHNAALLRRQLDAEASGFFHNIVANAGINTLYSADLAAIEGQSPDFTLKMEDGRTLPAALIVFAAGVTPEITLAKAADLNIEKAIVINDFMETNLPGIYACGDCAQHNGRPGGLWTVAQAQGQIAGKNAAGAHESYIPVKPSYLMQAMGTKIWSGGDISPTDNYSLVNSASGDFQKLFFSEGILSGAILIGNTAKQTALKKAIDAKTPKDEAISLLS